MKRWLVLDVHYLAHRAFHAAQSLSWQGKPTGVVFQFLKSITHFKDEFQTDRIAFCFEHPHLFRKDLCPTYKQKRNTQERTEEEKKNYLNFVLQIAQLRTDYLPQIGFKNIFRAEGFESDDLMASICYNVPEGDEVIMITSDSDMLQCLGPNVSIYSPQARMLWTDVMFTRTWKIRPRQWAVVKAMAGCHTDEIKGIPRIGDATAVKYLRGELAPQSMQMKAIRSAEGRAIVRRNRPLVELPFAGCPVPHLQEDQLSRANWLKVCDGLGMRSIAAHPPTATRKMTSL